MSKKKKKKKNKKKSEFSMLKEIDFNLDETYESLKDEIERMQLKLYLEDQKALKKAKKKARKNPNGFSADLEKRRVRQEILNEMAGSNILDRVMKVLHEVSPIIVIIARLIASLILAILSIDAVKVHIKPEYLKKMYTVYDKAMLITA
jgi:hypothetical protein